MTFGAQLRTERKKRNLSAEDLAGSCGVARSYITLIENGKRLPGKKIIPKIALALKVKLSVVIDWYLADLREKLEK